MKRCFYVIFVMFMFSAFIHAQSKFKYLDANTISIGAGKTLTTDLYGGFFDLGLNIYTRKSFFIRNYIEINFGGYESGYGFFGMRERIIAGSIIAVTDSFGVRKYGGIDLGFSFYSVWHKDDFFDVPYILELRSFGGIEFLFNHKEAGMTAAFIEAGGGGRFFVGDDKKVENNGISMGTVFITFGGRYYF